VGATRKCLILKTIKELMLDKSIERIIDWDLHPFEAVTRYLEWGTNWSRGLDHAKSCNEEAAYFKINAILKPPRLLLVKQSHKDYEIISEVEAPQEMIDECVDLYACNNSACGISDKLREWLKKESQ
jgi:hypothetical protein